MRPFRILSLDGGGIKGAFSAGVLAQLEEEADCSISDHFDLIVGTSTGGILALGLAMGFTANDLLSIYEQHGSEIFPSSIVQKAFGRFRHVFGPKHDQNRLRQVLMKKFGDKKLGHAQCRLVIPTFDALKGHACTFKTAHHPRLNKEYMLLAADVAVATAAAPTYFRGAEIPGRTGATYIDGGVWANCPSTVGIIEAISFLDVDAKSIWLLSVGTTEELADFTDKKNSGWLAWNKGLIDAMMAAQVSSANFQAKLLLGERYLRINHSTVPNQFHLDDGRNAQIAKLIALGRSVARSHDISDRVAQHFLNGEHAAPFDPYHTV